MKILITGATGFIGRNAALRLLREGHIISVLVRNASKASFLKSAGAQLICKDITDKNLSDNIGMRDFDVIIHCAGLVQNCNYNKLYSVNVKGSENICRLALELGVKKLIYTSSVSVISGNDKPSLTDDLPYKASNLYGKSKMEAEKIVVGYRQKGLRIAILRPSMVYGENEPHLTNLLLTLMKYRLMPMPGNGAAKWHLVYIKNLVEVYSAAVKNDAYLDGTFLVADEEVLTVKEIFKIFSENIGGKMPYSLPDPITGFLRYVPYFGDKIRFFLKDRVYDTSRLRAAGCKMPHKAQDALKLTAKHWIKKRRN
ncbi:MAG: 3 beta-hydroxysteroid dehydrogenase/Delta 5--_4-isomerase [Elusimicrobia bacterium ADurb.Bin231]|nr:MAG: 3 beta-hydroxysteroid dehydrogenase/Delta 5-->4-isomerase [Elusimicrobia bacterium ADurb.Bin231]